MIYMYKILYLILFQFNNADEILKLNVVGTKLLERKITSSNRILDIFVNIDLVDKTIQISKFDPKHVQFIKEIRFYDAQIPTIDKSLKDSKYDITAFVGKSDKHGNKFNIIISLEDYNFKYIPCKIDQVIISLFRKSLDCIYSPKDITFLVCFGKQKIIYNLDRTKFSVLDMSYYLNSGKIRSIQWSHYFRHSVESTVNSENIFILTNRNAVYKFDFKSGIVKRIFMGYHSFEQCGQKLIITTKLGLKLCSNNQGDQFNEIFFVGGIFNSSLYASSKMELVKVASLRNRIIFVMRHVKNSSHQSPFIHGIYSPIEVFISDIYGNRARPINNNIKTQSPYMSLVQLGSEDYNVDIIRFYSECYISFNNGDNWKLIHFISGRNYYNSISFIDLYNTIGTVIVGSNHYSRGTYFSYDGCHTWENTIGEHNFLNVQHVIATKSYVFIALVKEYYKFSFTHGKTWHKVHYDNGRNWSIYRHIHIRETDDKFLHFFSINYSGTSVTTLKLSRLIQECDKKDIEYFIPLTDERMIYKQTKKTLCFFTDAIPQRNTNVTCHYNDYICDFNFDRTDDNLCKLSNNSIVAASNITCNKNIRYEIKSNGYLKFYSTLFYEEHCKEDKYKVNFKNLATDQTKCDSIELGGFISLYEFKKSLWGRENSKKIWKTITLTVVLFIICVVLTFSLLVLVQKLCPKGVIRKIIINNPSDQILTKGLVNINEDHGNSDEFDSNSTKSD